MTDGSPGRWCPWPLAEPAVALTDWALDAECACCVAALVSWRGDDRLLRVASFAFFGATGIAAALGGIVHGYLPDPRHPWQPRLWGATLLALGAGGAAAWTIAARVALSPRRSRGVLALGALGYTAYGGIILSGRQQFGTGTTLLDLTGLSRILAFDPERGEIEVEAGIQWPALIDELVASQRGAARQWGSFRSRPGPIA